MNVDSPQENRFVHRRLQLSIVNVRGRTIKQGFIPSQPPVIWHDANMCFITPWTGVSLASRKIRFECYLLHYHAHNDDYPFLHDGIPPVILAN